MLGYGEFGQTPVYVDRSARKRDCVYRRRVHESKAILECGKLTASGQPQPDGPEVRVQMWGSNEGQNRFSFPGGFRTDFDILLKREKINAGISLLRLDCLNQQYT
jgi:hypothetical protein